MKGVTLEQSLEPKKTSLEHSMSSDGLQSIGRTAGIKAALSAENRGEDQLIKPDGH